MDFKKQLIAMVMVFAFVFALTMSPFAAMANETGKKHTAITLGATSLGAYLTHHGTIGLLSGLGALFTYGQYQTEHNHNKQAKAYQQGYRQGASHH